MISKGQISPKNGKEKEEKTQQRISYDAPPLDFSFKNIKSLAELKDVEPRQGEKFSPREEEAKNKTKQEEKELGDQGEDEHRVGKRKDQVIKLVPQNNLNSVVSTMIASSAMKNISTKAKEQLQKKKKKCIQVKLVCVSLMLGYNKIRELTGLGDALSGIMQNARSLQWIDISHNYLVTIDNHFSDFPQLKTLYIHCNFISDIGQLENLKNLGDLKTMTIHGNPFTTIPNFRVLAISILPELKKLDSVLISKKERDNAVFIRSQTKKYPLPKNPPLPPQEKQQAEQEQHE